MFADTAAGGSDYCAVHFLSKTKLDVPLVYHAKVLATDMTDEIYPVLNKLHDATGIKPVVAYENNNGGVFEMERLAKMNRYDKYDVFKMHSYGKEDNPEPVKLGWNTNTATRPKMISDLKQAIDNKLLKVYDKPTIQELYSFIVVQTSSSWKAQAEKGAHDDLVMSLSGAWQMYQLCEPPISQEHGMRLMTEFPDEQLFNDEGFY